MASPYQEFVRKARERYEENKKKKLERKGQYQFTAHAEYKMKQYALSEQKVKSVMRSPKRKETGIAPKTVAVMQPVSAKMVNGKEVWKQEIWVMFVKKNKLVPGNLGETFRIISTWRYPGISPKRSFIPEDILQELEDGAILEGE